jgi:hypothetical protein
MICSIDFSDTLTYVATFVVVFRVYKERGPPNPYAQNLAYDSLINIMASNNTFICLVQYGVSLMSHSTSTHDAICAQLIQLSDNQLIIDTMGHQLTTLSWSIPGGSLSSYEKFFYFDQFIRHDFDVEELHIEEFIIKAHRNFPSLNM